MANVREAFSNANDYEIVPGEGIKKKEAVVVKAHTRKVTPKKVTTKKTAKKSKKRMPVKTIAKTVAWLLVIQMVAGYFAYAWYLHGKLGEEIMSLTGETIIVEKIVEIEVEPTKSSPVETTHKAESDEIAEFRKHIKAYFPQEEEANGMKMIKCEGKNDPNALYEVKGVEYSVGLFQINLYDKKTGWLLGEQRAAYAKKHMGYTGSDLKDFEAWLKVPENNIQYGSHIWERHDWGSTASWFNCARYTGIVK